MISLYYHPLSPYARKVRIALDYKGVPYQVVQEELFGADGPGEKLKARSARAEVPLIEDGGVRIWDSTVICEYLEDAYPQKALLPVDPAARARSRLLEDRCDTLFDAAMYGLYYAKVLAAGKPRAAEVASAATAEVKALMREFEAALGNADFLCGGSVAVADIALFTQVSGAVALGIPVEGGALQGWMGRMMALPCVQKDMEAAQAAMAELGAGDSRTRHQWRSDRIEFLFRHGVSDFLLAELEAGRVYFPPTPGDRI